jgi:8-oxo-dGTP pyrophosphatase MutT (NUDIX family)
VEIIEREKSCGAVVIRKFDDEYKVLLIKHNNGHWSFPKGHVEKGETEELTALREIKEETSLETSIDTGFRHVVSYSPKEGVLKDVVYFIATSLSIHSKPQFEEIQKCEWFCFKKAKNTLTYDNDKELFECAMKYIFDNYIITRN